VSDSSAPTWHDVVVPGSIGKPGNAVIAARDGDSMLVAQESGVSVVDRDGSVVRLTDDDFVQALLFGFTNDQLGFAVTVDGVLWQTDDGGQTWTEQQVVPPSP
jgi:hypothetical protein